MAFFVEEYLNIMSLSLLGLALFQILIERRMLIINNLWILLLNCTKLEFTLNV